MSNNWYLDVDDTFVSAPNTSIMSNIFYFGDQEIITNFVLSISIFDLDKIPGMYKNRNTSVLQKQLFGRLL